MTEILHRTARSYEAIFHQKPLFDVKLQILTSYHYHKKTNFRSLSEKFPVKAEYFADSGAFSAQTLNSKLSIDDYAQWLIKHQDHISRYVNFDVVSNPKQTALNQEYLEKEYGLHPLPVFHAGSLFNELDKLMKRYNYIALGGLVARSSQKQDLYKFIIRCFEMAQINGTKFHGFGLTSFDLMRYFEWKSIDSSTWCVGSKFGEIPIFDIKKGLYRISVKNKTAIYKHSRYLRNLGIEPQEIIDHVKDGRDIRHLVGLITFMFIKIWICGYRNKNIDLFFADGGTTVIKNISKFEE